jgi:hypothetical protein
MPKERRYIVTNTNALLEKKQHKNRLFRINQLERIKQTNKKREQQLAYFLQRSQHYCYG